MVHFLDTLDSMLRLQSAFDKVMGEDFFGATTFQRGAYPAISLMQKKDEVLLRAEIPGFKKDDISIEISDDIIRLHGERKREYDMEKVSMHRRERSFGRFDRKLKLPFAVDGSKSKAEYKDGILSIHLPQAEQSKPKQIAIH